MFERNMMRCTIATLMSVFALAGCAGPSITPSSPRAFTPPKYVEHRVLFAQEDNDNKDIWNLRFGYQLRNDTYTEAYSIKPGSPISVVVSDVYLPRDFNGTKDVVVLLDIHANETRGTESYAVWYQRGVRGGQRLAFDSLLVYSDRAWSPLNPPRFTLRVIDVSTERNEETRQAFTGLNSAISGLASFVPNPAFAGAAAAIKVAGLVLGNRANVTIIDFTPQFYSPDFIRQAGANDLPMFTQGQWLVIGRAPEGSPIMQGITMPEEFWKKNLYLDRRTGVVSEKETGIAAGAPYIRMTIAAIDSTVPKVVLEHSEQLFKLLSGPTPSVNVVQAIGQQLTSSLTVYSVHKQFLSDRTIDSLATLFTTLGSDGITAEDNSFLLAVVGRITGQAFANAKDASEWWRAKGVLGGMDPKTGLWRPAS